MSFDESDRVEVCSQEEGFVGSYYAATILSKLNETSYKVVYKRLLENDESGPLVETVSVNELRPVPPRTVTPTGFRRLEIVDAFGNDGWWMGEIVGRKGNLYSVYFPTTGEKLDYPIHRLRRHLDWVNGTWVSSTRRGF